MNTSESAFEGNLKNWRWYGPELECGCGKQQFNMDARPGDTCAVCDQPLRLPYAMRRQAQAGQIQQVKKKNDQLFKRQVLYANWDPEQVISRRVREELKVVVAELELWVMPNYGRGIDERHEEFCRNLDARIGMACLRIAECVL